MFDLFRKAKLKKGITASVFECKRDSLTIRGTEYRLEGEDFPIAIVCHGFMAWQDTVRHYATDSVTVVSRTLDYQIDTKGFYQPVYIFEILIPETGNTCLAMIPAMK